jgi:putative transposase
VVKVASLLQLAGDWRQLLKVDPAAEELATLRSHERTGRPLGSLKLLRRLETRLNRLLLPQKPGRKPCKRKQ